MITEIIHLATLPIILPLIIKKKYVLFYIFHMTQIELHYMVQFLSHLFHFLSTNQPTLLLAIFLQLWVLFHDMKLALVLVSNIYTRVHKKEKKGSNIGWVQKNLNILKKRGLTNIKRLLYALEIKFSSSPKG